MAESPIFVRILGSAVSGAIGFVIGFYAGFFVLLSIWGLETGELAFVLIAGGAGVLASGGAIAFTVRRGRKRAAFLTTTVLGLVLLALILVIDGDFGVLVVGGLILVIAVSFLVRIGFTDTPEPIAHLCAGR